MNSRLAIFAAVTTLSLTFGAGCASTGTGATATTPLTAGTQAQTQQWEKVELASGVELRVSEEAGPEARRVVEMIQSEMRSRYLSAR